MESLNNFLSAVDDFVWGIPLIVLIMACGLLLTIRGRGLQFLHLGKALKFMVKNEKGGEGEVSSFAALCTALSATIGTGNIVGVATAMAGKFVASSLDEEKQASLIDETLKEMGDDTWRNK